MTRHEGSRILLIHAVSRCVTYSVVALVSLSTSIAQAAPVDRYCIDANPSPLLIEAVNAANDLLVPSSSYKLRVAKRSNELNDKVSDREILTFTLCSHESVGLFVISGVDAIFFHPDFANTIFELTKVDEGFIDKLEMTVERSEQFPEGYFLKNGVPGKEFTKLGLSYMRRMDTEPRILLAAMLLHELGHLHHRHGVLSIKERNTDSRKRQESVADEFAADLLAQAMLSKEAAQSVKSTAFLMFHHFTMVGFLHAGNRILSGEDIISDPDANYEDWELRIFRMLQLTAEAIYPNSEFSLNIANQLDQLLLARGEISREKVFAKALFQQLNKVSEQEKQAKRISERLNDPALLPLDPERSVLLIAQSQIFYNIGDYGSARDRLADALVIATRLGQRRKVRAIQILGPMAVISHLMGDEEKAKIHCVEVVSLLAGSSEVPPEFREYTETICNRYLR
ncbi:hypothetical protein ROS1_60040 [Roseibium sp. ROS1]